MTSRLGLGLALLVTCSAAYAQQADPLLLPKQCRDLWRSIPTRIQIAKNWQETSVRDKQRLDTEAFCSDTSTAISVVKALRDEFEVCMANIAADPHLTQSDIEPVQQGYLELSNEIDIARRSGGDYDRLCRR